MCSSRSSKTGCPGAPSSTLLTQVVVDQDDPGVPAPDEVRRPRSTTRRRRGSSPPSSAGRSRPTTSTSAASCPRRSRSGIVEIAVDSAIWSTPARSSSARAAAASRSSSTATTSCGGRSVIDKDLAAELLARALECRLPADAHRRACGACRLGRRRPAAARMRRRAAELRRHTFAAGSMGPKVEAACRFVEATGGTAAIGALEDAAEILAGRAGTTLVPAAFCLTRALSGRRALECARRPVVQSVFMMTVKIGTPSGRTRYQVPARRVPGTGPSSYR